MPDLRRAVLQRSVRRGLHQRPRALPSLALSPSSPSRKLTTPRRSPTSSRALAPLSISPRSPTSPSSGTHAIHVGPYTPPTPMVPPAHSTAAALMLLSLPSPHDLSSPHSRTPLTPRTLSPHTVSGIKRTSPEPEFKAKCARFNLPRLTLRHSNRDIEIKSPRSPCTPRSSCTPRSLRATHSASRELRPVPRRTRSCSTPSLNLSPMGSPFGTSPKESGHESPSVSPALLNSIQDVRLGSSPPEHTSNMGASSIRATATSLPPVMSLKRSNPKGLSLTLSLGASSFHNSTMSDSTTPTPTTACHTRASPYHQQQAVEMPSTPGLPKTPQLAVSGGNLAVRSSLKARRGSLLSLVSNPPMGDSLAPPPTPGGAPYPYTGAMRSRGHARMRSNPTASYLTEFDPRASQSAYPLRGIDERAAGQGSSRDHHMSPSTSSASNTASSTSTPTTSPPLGESGDEKLAYPQIALEPYADGPIEIIPGVYLGAEDSLWHWNSWARGSQAVGCVNVAQEIENPFLAPRNTDTWDWPTNHKGKAKVALSTHAAESDHPEVGYAHLRWSHGEGGLADVPSSARLDNLVGTASFEPSANEPWRFWEAVQWLEARRRAGVPVIIHCQCGVSRSATLTVAYIMTLAAAGLAPEHLGHLRTMQDAYDFVKAKSPWIGPNVSLVFQLVEYARNLSMLLSSHMENGGAKWDTQWPTLVDMESEEAWANRRRAFGDEVETADSVAAGEEARALDEAMAVRASWRE